MKVVMVFKLPEEKDQFEYAQRGADWMNVVDDMVKWLRDRVKHDTTLSAKEHGAYEKAYQKLWEIQGDYALSVWVDGGYTAPRVSEPCACGTHAEGTPCPLKTDCA